MIDKIILIAHLLFLGILLNSNCVSSISRDHKHNASSTNYSYYDNERESRQFPASGYGTGAGLGGLGGLSGYGGKYTLLFGFKESKICFHSFRLRRFRFFRGSD